VPISGQDATADGCNSIVKGELTVSIRDIRNPPPSRRHGRRWPGGVELKSHAGRADQRRHQEGNVKALFLPVFQVTDNVLTWCRQFQSYDDAPSIS
jgi:D-xylose transport system substrate-binding protein